MNFWSRYVDEFREIYYNFFLNFYENWWLFSLKLSNEHQWYFKWISWILSSLLLMFWIHMLYMYQQYYKAIFLRIYLKKLCHKTINNKSEFYLITWNCVLEFNGIKFDWQETTIGIKKIYIQKKNINRMLFGFLYSIQNVLTLQKMSAIQKPTTQNVT